MVSRQKLYKTQAVVLKRRNYGESDRILTILTKDLGKINVIAKGIRKISSKRSGHLEIFTNAQFTLYEGRTFDYVTEVSAIEQFDSFRGNLVKASFAYYLCELANALVPDRQEQQEIYHRLCKSLSTLNTSSSEAEYHTEIYTFALDILWYLGFLPKTQTIPNASINEYIESITERRLQTLKLLQSF